MVCHHDMSSYGQGMRAVSCLPSPSARGWLLLNAHVGPHGWTRLFSVRTLCWQRLQRHTDRRGLHICCFRNTEMLRGLLFCGSSGRWFNLHHIRLMPRAPPVPEKRFSVSNVDAVVYPSFVFPVTQSTDVDHLSLHVMVRALDTPDKQDLRKLQLLKDELVRRSPGQVALEERDMHVSRYLTKSTHPTNPFAWGI